jgi:hypothetical protein
MLGGADPIPTVAHAAIMALVRPPDAAVSSVLLYLDPGTGSLMVQAAIAAILTVPFIFQFGDPLIHVLRIGCICSLFY